MPREEKEISPHNEGHMNDTFPKQQTSKMLPPTGILYNYKSWIPFLRQES